MTRSPGPRLLSPFCVVRGGAADEVRHAAEAPDGEPLEVVRAGRLAALAAGAPAPGLSRRRLRVLHEAVALGGAVALPPDLAPAPADEVAELLRRLEAPLEGVLRRVEGRAEVAVRATWEPGAARRRAERGDAEVARLLERVRARSGPSYLERARLARARDAALAAERAELAAELRDRLAPAVAAWRSVPCREDDVVLRALCLVGPEEEAELRARAREAEEAFEPEGVAVRCLPPRPPRCFARVPAWLAGPRPR